MPPIYPGQTPILGFDHKLLEAVVQEDGGSIFDTLYNNQETAPPPTPPLQERVDSLRESLSPAPAESDGSSYDSSSSEEVSSDDKAATAGPPKKRQKVIQEREPGKKIVVSTHPLLSKSLQQDNNLEVSEHFQSAVAVLGRGLQKQSSVNKKSATKVKKKKKPVIKKSTNRPALGYVKDNPDLMKIWATDANRKLGLDLERISCGSKESAFWKCNAGKGHPIYSTRIGNKFSRGSGCFECVKSRGSQRLTKDTKLKGEWGNNRVEFSKAQARERYNWKCLKCQDHPEWQAVLQVRLQGFGNCPKCPKYVKSIKNPVSTAPILSKQWGTKNTLGSHEVGLGCRKDMWWKCLDNPEHPEWKARAGGKKGSSKPCPSCISEK